MGTVFHIHCFVPMAIAGEQPLIALSMVCFDDLPMYLSGWGAGWLKNYVAYEMNKKLSDV